MATVYDVNMTIVSEFVNCPEEHIKKLLVKLIGDLIDGSTGLGLSLLSDNIKVVRK